jgi:hypothetical protein
MRKLRKSVRLVLFIIIAVMLLLHVRERILLHEFVNKYLPDQKPLTTYEEVIEVRDSLYNVIDDGHIKNEFSHFDLRKRPRWGYSLSFIILNREGQCAEFTRLLYHVLRMYKVQSHPIILYGINGQQHSVVEFNLKGKLYLLDTNNAPEGLYELLKRDRKSISDYTYAYKSYRMGPLIHLDRYQLYSYFNISIFTYPLLGVNAYVTKPIYPLFIYLFNNVFLTFAIIFTTLFFAKRLLVIFVKRHRKNG